jgi:hypothetical protein
VTWQQDAHRSPLQDAEILALMQPLCEHVAMSDTPRGRAVSGRFAQASAPVDLLLTLLPFPTQTGAPYTQALRFIEEHDERRRDLLGGAFGIMDGRGMQFWVAEESSTAVDGMRICSEPFLVTAETTIAKTDFLSLRGA